MKYTEIKTWEDVCKYHNMNPELPDSSIYPEHMRKYMDACYQLPFIVFAINGKDEEGKQWQPHYGNPNRRNYFPWFEVKTTEEKPTGVGLSYISFDYWDSNTLVGSRLEYRDAERTKYGTNQFKEVYKDHHLI